MKKLIYYLLILCLYHSAGAQQKPFVLVLGVAQDGGYPHMGCIKQCCTKAWDNPALKKQVVSFALADPATKQWWLFEATPDIKEQLHNFRQLTDSGYEYLPSGIFITHAHIGHYTGLMELGREVMGTKEIPVYVLPKLKTFLETNGPWSQLVSLHNISLQGLMADSALELPGNIRVTAFTVPHRDEYSETAGFKISTPNKKYLFIPDIDKWAKWNRDIIEEVNTVDIALLDATFYDGTELPGRSIAEVPHPFVIETISLFENAGKSVKSKVHFIHMNHTNPLLWDKKKTSGIKQAGFNIAAQGQEL
jgi:pyrroloquinoline quinone biosynthesis protein B